ncbi:MAG: Mov34/MPN/PAD-1 family protein [Prosthecobacter sp.]|uniref:Mov34/MPN/PAD-1 family protein n=1 Tax=Prosthecobacter sp. TaxID=1965333 RepID=UPI0025ECF388|nr:Mov34/MPN/PAD-1 family protein [Prosthecobacter sp.]MCF7785153.1 Mov34/MPN/PAD-1 family protein [Prosthecobacter sp.]
MKKSSSASNKAAAADVNVTPAATVNKPVRKSFPGPRGAHAPLRVGVDREAQAEIVAHAKESLRAEVCGVMVGEVGQDDEGLFVHVQAVIRGTAASGGSTHVTFTQETWTLIHTALERDHPRKQMVGWYHTHPGFGVEFSEMDLFIQRNFFAGPSQIALVTDPITGAVAIAANHESGGVTYLPRYWVDGREQTASVPATASSGGGGEPGSSGSTDVRALEDRLNQITAAVEDLRTSLYHFLLTVGAVVCLGVVAIVGWYVRDQFRARVTPPEVSSYVPVPVKIGDKTVMLGVGVVKWDVPDELNALVVEMARLQMEEEAKREKEAEEKAAKEAPKESSKEPAKQPSKEAPKDTSKEAPKEALKPAAVP